MAKIKLHASFFGRVQGVGFRMLVLAEAEKRKINGWVKNMPKHDQVDACFQGDKKEIGALIEYLKSGVNWVQIDRVIIEEAKNAEEFDGFKINY